MAIINAGAGVLHVPQGDVTLRIGLPLPLDVVETLTALVGAAYPNAAITPNVYDWQITIPADDRKGPAPDPEVVAAAKHDRPDDPLADGDLTQFSQDSISIAPAEELQLHLGDMVRGILDAYPEAINYLEWTVTDRDTGARYVLSASKSPEQTPHKLRMDAEEVLRQVRNWAENRYPLAPQLLEELFDILPGVQMTPEDREKLLEA